MKRTMTKTPTKVLWAGARGIPGSEVLFRK
jgi:hypothetical protein